MFIIPTLRISLLLGFLLLRSHVFAAESWSGGWSGPGAVTEDNGTISSCGKMEIVINHGRQRDWEGLWLISGLPTCGFPSAFAASFQLDVQAGKLIHIREPIGEFSLERLTLLRYSKGFKEYVEIARNLDQSLSYRKVFTFQRPLETFVIEGRLKKNN